MNKKLAKPIDFDEMYPGRFIKAGLLLGRTVPTTILSVNLDELPDEDGKERRQGVLTLKGKDENKDLVLNKTNGLCLKAMFGRRVADWEGKRIWIYPDKTRFGQKVVDCIRIYGSPDIKSDIEVEINLPRRKATFMVMRNKLEDQRENPSPPPQQQNEPPPPPEEI